MYVVKKPFKTPTRRFVEGQTEVADFVVVDGPNGPQRQERNRRPITAADIDGPVPVETWVERGFLDKAAPVHAFEMPRPTLPDPMPIALSRDEPLDEQP